MRVHKYLPNPFLITFPLKIDINLYHCTVQLDINVNIHQLMHLFISPREH